MIILEFESKFFDKKTYKEYFRDIRIKEVVICKMRNKNIAD
jgi:hypothetical protein